MEYCLKLERNETCNRIFVWVTVLLFIAALCNFVPKMEYQIGLQNQSVSGGKIPEKVSVYELDKTTEILLNGTNERTTLLESPAEVILENAETGVSAAMLTAVGNVEEISENPPTAAEEVKDISEIPPTAAGEVKDGLEVPPTAAGEIDRLPSETVEKAEGILPPDVSGVTEIPSGKEDINAGEESTDSEENTAVSPFLIDESGMIYGFVPEYITDEESLVLPKEGCVGVRNGAFSENGKEICELQIPANITNIEPGAFRGMKRLEWIEVDAGNSVYTSVEGVLFDSSVSVLYAFPAGRTGAYNVPESVTCIISGAFADTLLSEIDMRNCKGIDYSALSDCPAALILPKTGGYAD